MVLALTSDHTQVFAIAVRQAWPSALGPTWAYLFQQEGWTLFDAGGGTFRDLKAGLECAGLRPQQIRRIILSHMHSDHDGNCARLAQLSGAEVWAHEVYAQLLSLDLWTIWERAEARLTPNPVTITKRLAARYRRIRAQRQKLQVHRALKDGEVWEGISFIHAPGHSPDALCLRMNGFLLAGDNILPIITPHPSAQVEFAILEETNPALAQGKQSLYGLRAYLESLKRLGSLAEANPDAPYEPLLVLPGHRLYSQGRLQLTGLERAWGTIEHHQARMRAILRELEGGERSLDELSRKLYRRAYLRGRGTRLGLSETASHVELLAELGDVELSQRQVRWLGSQNFMDFFASLLPASRIRDNRA